MKKMLSVKGKISVFYLPIYATMASLMAFSIYCYLIIDKSKQNIHYHSASQIIRLKFFVPGVIIN